jgi:hypothetical protein
MGPTRCFLIEVLSGREGVLCSMMQDRMRCDILGEQYLKLRFDLYGTLRI